MTYAIDSASPVPPDAARAYAGVIRYGSDFPSKNLSPAELHGYQAAHVPVALVWENNGTDYQGGPNAGAAYGHAARAHAISLGWPGDRPYRASFDSDVPASDFPLALAYLNAFVTACGHPGGAYASWPLLRYLDKEGGFSRFGWGVGASSWNTGWQPTSLDIQQLPQQAEVGSVTCDLNDVLSRDWGQWPAPAPPPAKGNPVALYITVNPAGNAEFLVNDEGPWKVPISTSARATWLHSTHGVPTSNLNYNDQSATDWFDYLPELVGF